MTNKVEGTEAALLARIEACAREIERRPTMSGPALRAILAKHAALRATATPVQPDAWPKEAAELLEAMCLEWDPMDNRYACPMCSASVSGRDENPDEAIKHDTGCLWMIAKAAHRRGSPERDG